MHVATLPKTLLTLLLFACFAPRTSAQSMTVSEAITIRNDYGYELIGRLRDRILVFRDKYDEFEVQAYDTRLRLSWNKQLEDLENKGGTQILSVIPGKNDFSILFKVRKKGVHYLRLHKYDPGANLIDSVTLKNYGERVFNAPALEVVRSEDRNCIVVYNTAERISSEMLCFRVDKMQRLWEKTMLVQEDFWDDQMQDIVVSNQGQAYIVSEFNNRKPRLDEHHYQILQLEAGNERVSTLSLKSFFTQDARFIFDNLNNCLVGAGLYSEKGLGRANGTFYTRVHPIDSTKNLLRFDPFDDKILSIMRRKDVEDDTRGITDASVRQVVLRRDGGILLVGERHHEVQRGAASGRGLWRDGLRVVVDFYYDDVFMVAMNPDGTMHWHTVLHKRQYSQDDDGIFSSVFLLRNADRLHVMFNDEIKYENTCSEYIVSAAGQFDRNSLLSTFDQELRLRFRDALQISTNECIVPSEYRNRLRLVLLRI